MTVHPRIAGSVSVPRSGLLVVLRVLLGGALVLAFLFVFATVPAGAFVTHEQIPGLSEQISKGVPAVGPKGEPVPAPGPFKELFALAVSSGELYVLDINRSSGFAGRLDKFDAQTGAFVSQFPPTSFAGLAVAKATGDVYIGGYGQVGTVEVFSAAGERQAVWNGAGTPSGSFGCFVCGSAESVVAVDNSTSLGDWASGDVYVASPRQHVVDVFEPGSEEKYVAQLTGVSPSEPFSDVSHVAVSEFNGDVLVRGATSTSTSAGVYLFKPGLTVGQYEFVGKLTPPSGGFAGFPFLAVDGSNGEIYASEGSGVYEFSAAGAFLGDFQLGEGASISPVAVDPSTHDVYLGSGGTVQVFGPDIVLPDVTNAPASSVKPGSATLNGTVNPDEAGEATCRFVWGTTREFGNEAPCEPESVSNGGSPVPVHAVLGGLAPDTTYYFRLQATNKADGHTNPGDPSQDQEFKTPGPGIHLESVSSVTSSSATLNATIDPNRAPTTYYFQYGTSSTTGCGANPASCTDAPVAPGEMVGSGSGDVEVAPRHLQGLSPNTVYHYRVLAVSEPGGEPITVEGPDHTFTTQGPAAPSSLVDGREWELVSPPDKHGALIEPIFIGTPSTQASSSGGGMAYLTGSPTEADPAGNANLPQVFSARGPDGWVSRDISLPHSEATGLALQRPDYRMFSSDLSLAVVQPLGPFDPALSAEASEQTAYLRSDYSHGVPGTLCATSCFRPLVTAVPGFADVPAGIEFGVNRESGERCPPNPLCGPELIGATPDLSHVVLYSGVGLTSTSGENGYLYEWSGGSQLQPVGVLPDGKPAGAQSGPGQGAGGYHVGPLVVRNSVSADGSRVFFTDNTTGLLYVREGIGTAQARTVPVPVPGSVFETASVDGSRVFVLGVDGGELGKLSEFDVETEVSTPLASGVQGVIGASEDGSSVYFVSNTVLTGEVKNGSGATAQAGQPNLYLSRGGVTTFIATLSQEDAPDWEYFASAFGFRMTARVSPDGGSLAFMSQRSLTGYDNRDALSGMPDEEVYLYRAPTGGGGGVLACASCDPTGARPRGIEYERLSFGKGTGLVSSGGGVWGSSQWLAANVPAWTSPFYQSRYLSDSGRLFFDSSDALVPQDTNGTEDVYEYEPAGVGGCSSESPTFVGSSGGCVGLVSSGSSAEESGFLDASESGGDVFFVTKARLAPRDVDSSFDVYDAHECTNLVPCLPASPLPVPACDGDACQPPVSPASDLSPASFTFSGSGNVNPAAATVVATRVKGLTRAQRLAGALKQCRKRSKRKRPACEKHARRAYGSERKAATSRKGGSR